MASAQQRAQSGPNWGPWKKIYSMPSSPSAILTPSTAGPAENFWDGHVRKTLLRQEKVRLYSNSARLRHAFCEVDEDMTGLIPAKKLKDTLTLTGMKIPHSLVQAHVTARGDFGWKDFVDSLKCPTDPASGPPAFHPKTMSPTKLGSPPKSTASPTYSSSPKLPTLSPSRSVLRAATPATTTTMKKMTARAQTPQSLDSVKSPPLPLKRVIEKTVNIEALKRDVANALEARHRTVREAFRSIDKDASGKLSREEALAALTAWNMSATDAEIDELMRSADTDRDGELSHAEFAEHVAPQGRDRALSGKDFMPEEQYVQNNFHALPGGQVIFNDNLLHAKESQLKRTSMVEPEPALPLAVASVTRAELDKYQRMLIDKVNTKYAKLKSAFRQADRDHSGHISLPEMIATVKHFHLPIPEQHLEQLITHVIDTDADGKVDFEEFADALKNFDVGVVRKVIRHEKKVAGALR